jgi:hypothetical protein
MQPKPVPTITTPVTRASSVVGAGRRYYGSIVADERVLGAVGTKVVFENEQVRVWVLQLAPGERSAVHRHDLDHLLIQIRGDRIAVEPEPDAEGPHHEYMEADVIPGMVVHVPKGGIETAVNVGADPYYEVIVELKE